jgi:hypothetical protein
MLEKWLLHHLFTSPELEGLVKEFHLSKNLKANLQLCKLILISEMTGCDWQIPEHNIFQLQP